MSSVTTRDLPARWVYPQRREPKEGRLDRGAAWLADRLRALRPGARLRRVAGIVDLVAPHEAEFAQLSDAALAEVVTEVKGQLHREGLEDPAIGRAFALVREVAHRAVGKRPYDVQLMGGYALLLGMLAEMQTGEGKTLTATLPAATAALAGIPVHVITVNDYLATRDAALMRPVYEALGLTVGVVEEGMAPGDRRAAYRCDVTYGTNKQLAFDHLRDRILLSRIGGNLRLKIDRLHADQPAEDQLLMRGLHFAIVDEADSVLVDEARTPLIISQQTDAGAEARIAGQALELASGLSEGIDWFLAEDGRLIELTGAGRERVAAFGDRQGGLWRGSRRSEEMAVQALSALHLYRRDEHYLVRDGRVQIIDEFTGRVMADRFWGQGLHQMIEAKEGVAATGNRVTIAQMTYQRFFRRYQRLAGMTGTGREVSGELWSVYRLPFVEIPTHRPVRRVQLATRIFPDATTKWRAVADRAAALRAAGRPVLIGTRTVASSDAASAALATGGLPHRILSAAQDADEAEVVAQAGRAGAVTVATNMAGRGTDIQPPAEAIAAGGLHVMICEMNDARRVDRQLAGRSGRQGDPGSYEYWLSLEDAILADGRGRIRNHIATAVAIWHPRLAARLGWHLLSSAQRRLERSHARIRRIQFELDRRRGITVAFSGRLE